MICGRVVPIRTPGRLEGFGSPTTIRFVFRSSPAGRDSDLGRRPPLRRQGRHWRVGLGASTRGNIPKKSAQRPSIPGPPTCGNTTHMLKPEPTKASHPGLTGA